MRQYCRFAVLLLLAALALAGLQVRAAENEASRAEQASAGDVASDSSAKAAEGESAEDADPPAGHSMHGEAFNQGPRRSAYLMDGMPQINFPVTTSEPDAQRFFNQGVAQLHGFWYFEAERSFRQAAAIDPDCAMAYWGMAMANANNDTRAKGFIAEAVERKEKATAREKKWIELLARYLNAPDNAARRTRMVEDLEALVHEDPNDTEALAFLALKVWDNAQWRNRGKNELPMSSHQAVDALLSDLFALAPMHPAHHYRIHLWDRQKPERALQSSALCGPCSPGIAHMWHMPGHIYSRLHRYADAVWQQEASARVDHAHMIRDRVMPFQIHNYAHNNEWLIRNLSFVGRLHDAVDLAKNMIELPRHPELNNPSKGGSGAAYGIERLRNVLVQYERWDDILSLDGGLYMPPPENPVDRARRHLILARAYAGVGDSKNAAAQAAELESVVREARERRVAAADEAEAKARAEKKTDKQVAEAMTQALLAKSGEIKQLEKHLTAARAFKALADGDKPAALEHLKQIEDFDGLTKDHLARAFLDAGEPARAEEIARKAVQDGPQEIYPLATLVEILAAANKTNEAKQTFEQLRTLAAELDQDTALYKRLTVLAASWGIEGDWRKPAPPADDIGIRPPLDSLGPFRWRPAVAPDWSGVDTNGVTRTSAEFRGKPVVLIFFLGAGCLHCAEQLQAFAPLDEKFAAEGISLVAISLDTQEGLAKSLENFGPNPPAIELVADPELTTFRAYQAYDDFEKQPLHGTFIIDGDGYVRWSDISFEPFEEAQFVLDEARRLLKAPVETDQK